MSNLITLVSFTGSDGVYPYGSLIADANGNLFGTTEGGGVSNCGTVFEIAKTASGYASAPTILVSFTSDAAFPYGSLIADANGDLFGTTYLGGAGAGGGTVFEIAKTATGYASAPTILVSFTGSHGYYPHASLIADANGDLFGTTSGGYGTVFEIAKTASGYASTPTVLVSFTGSDGAYPHSSLIADANGDLFGTTTQGGANGYGTVFEIAKTASGYASTPTTLVSFTGIDADRYSSLIADANGNLFGTTGGGGASGYGTVFEIAKTASGYASTPTTLVSFTGIDGANPFSSLVADANGNLFGTTGDGGASGYGTVFEIAKTATGYASAPTILVNFTSSDGAYPYASLIADANGDLFGATGGGGANGQGTVFEITDSGFQTLFPHPTATPVTPSVVEGGQTTVVGIVMPGLTGDTLTLTQTGGAGTLALGAIQADGTQQVIYTAASSVGASAVDTVTYTITDQQHATRASGLANVQLDAGPSITATTPLAVEKSQGTVVGTVTPGLTGDTLTLTQTGGTGTLALGAVQADGTQQVIYTAASAVSASALDNVTYTVADQHNDAVASGTASLQLDAGPSITATTPLAVEKSQSTVVGTVTPGLTGDTLTLTQTGGTGTLTLGAVQADGTQQVIYTAASAVSASALDTVTYTVADQHNDAVASGSASVQLDAGPTITATTPLAVEKSQSTVVGTVTPGLTGDTLTLTQTSGTGTLALGAVQADGTQQVLYTAASAVSASALDTVTYTITDQHSDAAASGSASVQLDAGPSITATTPLAVEKSQSTVVGTVTPGLTGDTLTLTQTGGTGTLALGAVQADGTQQVLYTAASAVSASALDTVTYTVADQHNDAVASGSASVQLDAGPSITLLPFNLGSAKHPVTIATATPGLPTDTLSLEVVSMPSNGNLVLTGSSVQFTPSSSNPATFSFDVKDQLGGVSPVVTVIAGGNGNATLTGSASGYTDISLGIGTHNITLAGSYNTVDASNGANTVTGGVSNNTITLGNGGPDSVTLSGGNNTISLGNADGTITVGGSANQINLGRGNDVMHGGTGDIISFANTTLTLYGTGEMTFIGSGNATVNDFSTGLNLKVGPTAGNDILSHFASDPTGIVDLIGGVGGFTTASQVVSALKSDGHGGTLLSFGHGSSLDFTGILPSHLQASNFQIG